MRPVFVVAACLAPATVAAQADSTLTATWGAFVDTYYAYHFNLRRPGDLPILTQPARHNEFNVNLMFIEVKLSGERLRGRIALQAGTSVQANYAGEPANGSNSGPVLGRHIQEAVAGYRVADQVWVDAGIFLSHIGSESWISRDNWTYTRSLIADYSPYYESGVKATWSPSSRLTATLVLMNGWQNISERNANKALGIRIDYNASDRLLLGYSNFLGNEAAEGSASQLRFFHDIYGRLMLIPRLGVIATFDIGTQKRTGDGGARWYGLSVVGRLTATEHVALNARFERYADPDGVLFGFTSTGDFTGNGFSVGLDAAPARRILWRTEFRSLRATDAVFTKHDGGAARTSPFVVSSFALTF